MHLAHASQNAHTLISGKMADSHSSTGPAETVGQIGHLPYHFLVVHTGNDVAMIFIRDSEVG